MNDTRHSIHRLMIEGFKSIRNKENKPLALTQLNVLIGANGTGKTNFVSFFRMLGAMMNMQLQNWISNQGSADRILSFGVKETTQLKVRIDFGLNAYEFTLEPTVDGSFSFTREILIFDPVPEKYEKPHHTPLGSGHKEAKLKNRFETDRHPTITTHCYTSITNWKVFHFHDTSDTAGVKRWGALHDNQYLRPDASNLSAYLYRLSKEAPEVLDEIRSVIRLATPFFDDFILRPRQLPDGEEQINLQWKQKDSDYPLWPSQLSDGSIRFICLVTALLQPKPPTTIIIDEPELGLHPYAITLLGALLRSASHKMQIVIATQSVPLVNQFTIDDLIVVERENGNSIFKRLSEKDFTTWLKDYSVGELWEKNMLGGRP